MDLEIEFSKIDLFSHLSPEDLWQVIGLAEEHHVEAGVQLTRQADLGATFFFVESGECLIERVNEQGQKRPDRTEGPGFSFGVTSLFVGEPRDATITAVTPMTVWVIRRPDFQRLLARNAGLRRQLQIPPDVVAKLRAPRYPWLDQGEFVVLHTRRHWLVFVRSISLITIVLLAYLGFLAWSVANWQDFAVSLWVALVPVLVLYVPAFIWLWVDWRNDYFAVTTRRITRRERVAFLYESRQEIPIDRVQNVRVARDLTGRLADYGSLTIETAAEPGTISFDAIPSPDKVAATIFDQIERAQALRRAQQRLKIRETLARHLGLELPAPAPEEGAEDDRPLDDIVDELEPPEVRPGFLARAMMWLAERQLIPQTRVQQGETIMWRKHWIFLAADVLGPTILSLATIFIAVLALFHLPTFMTKLPMPWGLYQVITFGVALVCSGWLWWEFADWGNDLYILTDERIIDVEKKPLFFSEQRREASLGMIQNVTLEVPNLWASLLRYGNVKVQTAGAGEFTFDRVPNPHDVQTQIFQRMRVFRDAQTQNEAARRREEMAEWFSVYRELPMGQRQGRPPADGPAPDQAQQNTPRDL